ncbi:MAG: hypothetical protein SGJ17_12910 [Hyphomicrobiales bacterium]|nr:hypothetical protein [Hyphomicrobiales bacterium]
MTIWSILGLVGLTAVFIFILAKMSAGRKGASRARNVDGTTSW